MITVSEIKRESEGKDQYKIEKVEEKFNTNESETIDEIWKLYHSSFQIQLPESVLLIKKKILAMLIDLHRCMKLPIEALYMSVNIFDRYFSEANHKKILNNEDQLFQIAIACLYCSHKLEKTRSQPLSLWVKNLAALNPKQMPSNNLDAIRLKKWEAIIMQTLNYHLISPTIFQILLAVYVQWNPSQKQFYFSQYLLQLSLFSDFNRVINQGEGYIDSATTLSDIPSKIPLFNIVLAICQLTQFFFPQNDHQIVQQFLKDKKQEKELVDQLANILFITVFTAKNNQNVKEIVKKYEKKSNLSISSLTFKNNISIKVRNNQFNVYVNE